MRREDGFTTIEVLVGAVLGALLMAALVSTFLTGYTSARTSQETLLGDEDVQIVLTYLLNDVHGASRDPSLLVVTGTTLQLAKPDARNGNRVLTVRYVYSTAGTPAVGVLSRTVTDAAGAVISSTTVARNLHPGLTTIFSATCTPASAGCTIVSAALSFDVRGATVTRTVNATPLLSYP